MDDHEKQIAARQVDAVVALTTTVDQLRGVVDQLAGSVTQLTALGLRLETLLNATPAE